MKLANSVGNGLPIPVHRLLANRTSPAKRTNKSTSRTQWPRTQCSHVPPRRRKQKEVINLHRSYTKKAKTYRPSATRAVRRSRFLIRGVAQTHARKLTWPARRARARVRSPQQGREPHGTEAPNDGRGWQTQGTAGRDRDTGLDGTAAGPRAPV